MDDNKKKNYWIALLVMLALLFIGGMGWSFYRAGTRVSSVVDPAYYDRGLHYNKTRAEQRAAQDMGWQFSTAVRQHHFEVRLFTGSSSPVTGCTGQLLVTLPGNRPGLPAILELKETAVGIYAVDLPPDLTGEVQAEMILGKNNVTVKRRLLLSVNGSSR